ncbi:MAG: PEGA domain-containing protein, partial [Myxococcota bacterium]
MSLPPAGTIYISRANHDDSVDGDFAKSVVQTVVDALKPLKDFPTVVATETESTARCYDPFQQLDVQMRKDCLSRIQRLTNARYIISPTLGKVGREYLVSLTLLKSKNLDSLWQEGLSGSTKTETLNNVQNLIVAAFGAKISKQEDAAFFAQEGVIKFGVVGIESSGITEAYARSLTEFLSIELSKASRAEVLSLDDIDTIRRKNGSDDASGCDDAEHCFGDVDILVKGQIRGFINVPDKDDEERSINEYIISLMMIDPQAVKVVKRDTLAFRGPKEELRRAIRTLARKLVGVNAVSDGTVTVTGPVTGANVFMAGERLGETPYRSSDGFKPGRVSLRVEKSGYDVWEADLFIQPGEENAVWPILEEKS